MAHVLFRLGRAALEPRVAADGRVLPPLISFQHAMKLRSQFYQEKQPWPYEDIVPGEPQLPPGSAEYAERRRAKDAAKQARLKEIQDAMAKMPTLISQYRENRKMAWEEVEPVDFLTMTRTDIKRKYIKRRLNKQANAGG